jgi:hypothetical protein
MIKEMYLLRGTGKENHNEFKERILGIANLCRTEIRPSSLRVTLTQAPPPAFSIIPFKKTKIAVISVYRENSDPIRLITGAEGFAGAFSVEEALPVVYERSWPLGSPSPGACLLTLFHRKPGIDQATFLDRWHNSHTPLTLKTHPLYSYNRNVVMDKLSDHPAWYDGIVEEQTRTRSELLNPLKFFGKPSRVIQNMLAVYVDTKSFLDYRKIETYLAAEYHLI